MKFSDLVKKKLEQTSQRIPKAHTSIRFISPPRFRGFETCLSYNAATNHLQGQGWRLDEEPGPVAALILSTRQAWADYRSKSSQNVQTKSKKLNFITIFGITM